MRHWLTIRYSWSRKKEIMIHISSQKTTSRHTDFSFSGTDLLSNALLDFQFIFDEYKKRLILPLMESDCILTSLLYEGSVRNH